MNEASKIKKYIINKNIELMELDDEWIIMDTGNYRITIINKMGAYILESLRDQQEIEGLVKKITDNFNIDSQRAKLDTVNFLEELKKIGVINNASEFADS